MLKYVPPGRIRPVLALGAALVALLLVAVGRGESPRSESVRDESKPAVSPPLKTLWADVQQCETCHRKSPTTRAQITDFVKLEEVDEWYHDKHSVAFARLKEPASRAIAAKLKWEVTTDIRCLSCHAPASASPEPEASVVEQGVSCSACHGAFREWTVTHGASGIRKEQEEWIRRDAKDKHDNYGMNDLRDPAVRAEVCASCHVGDAKQGRVITHAMYAAGHPPLPGFEVATFSANEPPHWWPMKDVPYFKKASEELRRQYGIDQSATQDAKLVAVGGLVSFRRAMMLFVETAPANGRRGFPDFARFDCSSCHHELKESADSYRQARGYATDPGRPPAANWPRSLLNVAVAAGDPARAAALRQALSGKIQAFEKAVGAGPFGDTPSSVQAAKDLAAWADALAQELDATKLDRAAALRMLHAIAAETPADHASARQLAWACRAIYEELDPKPEHDAEIRAAIRHLGCRLTTALHPGDMDSILGTLGVRLSADDNYDPKKVRELLERIGQLLPP